MAKLTIKLFLMAKVTKKIPEILMTIQNENQHFMKGSPEIKNWQKFDSKSKFHEKSA